MPELSWPERAGLRGACPRPLAPSLGDHCHIAHLFCRLPVSTGKKKQKTKKDLHDRRWKTRSQNNALVRQRQPLDALNCLTAVGWKGRGPMIRS